MFISEQHLVLKIQSKFGLIKPKIHTRDKFKMSCPKTYRAPTSTDQGEASLVFPAEKISILKPNKIKLLDNCSQADMESAKVNQKLLGSACAEFWSNFSKGMSVILY